MDWSTWLAFFAASWAISLSPGAAPWRPWAAGLLMGSGAATGPRPADLGIWTQVLLVGVGLGALVATSTTLFSLIKWAGVAYLVYLGVQQWRAPVVALKAADDGVAGGSLARRRDLVLRGWMVNTINPKGTVFLLAVVPQFLHLDQALTPQYLTIAATLGFTDLVVMGGYTALAAKVLGALKDLRLIRLMNRVFGGLFVAAGLLLASIKRS